MDFSLTDEQLGFKKLAREFLDTEVVPFRKDWDRAEAVDTALIPKLGEVGFFGLTIPEQYGGLGGDYITYCIGMEELGRADSAVRGIVSVSMGLVGKVSSATAPRSRNTAGCPASPPAGRWPASG